MEGTSAQNRRKRPLKKVFHWIHWHLLFLNNMMLFVGTHALSESRILEISFKVPVSHSWNNFKINCFGAWPVISQRTIQPSGIKGKYIYIYILCRDKSFIHKVYSESTCVWCNQVLKRGQLHSWGNPSLCCENVSLWVASYCYLRLLLYVQTQPKFLQEIKPKQSLLEAVFLIWSSLKSMASLGMWF